MADWKREAPTMKDVYGNSFCNISAIRSSHNVSFGLFGERFVEPRSFYPFSADLGLPMRQEQLVGKRNFWLDSLWINEINKAPLSSHGWVVQEKFLSRRVIHFTQTQIYWECLECCRCEADPVGQLGLLDLTPDSEVGRQAREYKAALRKIVRDSVPTDGRRTPTWNTEQHAWPALRECWRIMVTTYSRCDLSHESDRLIAISGVAKRFQEMYANDKYFDGIWKEGLRTDLLWESNAFQGASVLRDTAFAHSWSWASVRGGIVTVPTAHQKFGGEPNSCIQFVAARIRPEGGSKDSTALVQSSELGIKCVVHHFKRVSKSNTIEIFDDETFSNKIHGIEQEELRLGTKELVQKFGQNEDITGQCVPVPESNEGYGYHTVRYLLLEPVSVPKLRYKRLGTIRGGGLGFTLETRKHTCITLV